MSERVTAPDARWRLGTPTDRPGAIATFQIRGDIEAAFCALGIETVAVGECRVRDLAAVDRGVVARVSDAFALLMPHGGLEIVRQLCGALLEAGLVQDRCDTPRARFPEAATDFEAALLDTLSRATSPRAVDLLLAQPERWAAHGVPAPGLDTPPPDAAHSAALDRLVTPPVVVAIGASNIGKSTLLNRLAGRPVAVTADEPGTTRDHVGSLVDFDGLVVRYVDTPGLREGAASAEREALAIAARLLATADLVLCLGDRDIPAPLPPEGKAALRVALRADLGPSAWAHAAAVSALTGAGVSGLIDRVRRAMVPDEALDAETPWRFWGPASEDCARSAGPDERADST